MRRRGHLFLLWKKYDVTIAYKPMTLAVVVPSSVTSTDVSSLNPHALNPASNNMRNIRPRYAHTVQYKYSAYLFRLSLSFSISFKTCSLRDFLEVYSNVSFPIIQTFAFQILKIPFVKFLSYAIRDRIVKPSPIHHAPRSIRLVQEINELFSGVVAV